VSVYILTVDTNIREDEFIADNQRSITSSTTTEHRAISLQQRSFSAVFRLSKSVRQQLITLLGRQSRGRQPSVDWSTLAIHLGFDCR